MKDQKVIVRLAFCVIMLGSLGLTANHSEATTVNKHIMQSMSY